MSEHDLTTWADEVLEDADCEADARQREMLEAIKALRS
jgi:hypothetical protein